MSSLLYLSPGLFGFSRVGSYDYFNHIERGLGARFRDAGREVRAYVVDAHPTASIRRRAARLVEVVDRSAGEAGPIHLLGHSTGGLDARLVVSPSTAVGTAGPRLWASRVRSVTTMNTPHYGTPLASFFATVSGQRLLAAVSALTIIALKLGAPPLALTSSLVAAFGRIDQAIGLELRVIDNLTDRVVRALDDASSVDLRDYLGRLNSDQGAIIQLSPEAMDLFQAGVEDDPRVAYQSTASYAPQPGVMNWARTLLSPWASLSFPIFATLHRLTSLENRTYPCAPPGGATDEALARKLGHLPARLANDGVVPLRSQVYGELIWAGLGDHLDVVGHFADERARSGNHVDWLSSRSGFDSARFESLLDAIAAGMLAAEDNAP